MVRKVNVIISNKTKQTIIFITPLRNRIKSATCLFGNRLLVLTLAYSLRSWKHRDPVLRGSSNRLSETHVFLQKKGLKIETNTSSDFKFPGKSLFSPPPFFVSFSGLPIASLYYRSKLTPETKYGRPKKIRGKEEATQVSQLKYTFLVGSCWFPRPSFFFFYSPHPLSHGFEYFSF